MRAFAVIASAALAACLLVGCGRQAPQASGRKVVRVWHVWGGTMAEGFKKICDAFQAAHPEIDLRPVFASNDLATNEKFFTARRRPQASRGHLRGWPAGRALGGMGSTRAADCPLPGRGDRRGGLLRALLAAEPVQGRHLGSHLLRRPQLRFRLEQGGLPQGRARPREATRHDRRPGPLRPSPYPPRGQRTHPGRSHPLVAVRRRQLDLHLGLGLRRRLLRLWERPDHGGRPAGGEGPGVDGLVRQGSTTSPRSRAWSAALGPPSRTPSLRARWR